MVRSDKFRSGRVRSVRSDQVVQVRLGEIRTVLIMSGQLRSGQVSQLGQIRSGEVGQVRSV